MGGNKPIDFACLVHVVLIRMICSCSCSQSSKDRIMLLMEMEYA
jgi:hypothetical protein